jgi:D-lactate dehydrogenase
MEKHHMARRAFFEITAEDERYHWREEDRRGTFFSSDVFDASRLPNREQCEILSVFIQSHLDEKALNQVPNLKMIATRSTGYDHINLAYCKSRGITVSNVPVYGDNTVAEHTFALILALSRKVIQSYDRARSGHFSLAGLQGFDLRGKTLGVVGTGHIGIHVIRIARGFMMNVVAYDSKPDKRLADALDFVYVDSLDSLLAVSDIVTLHAPMAPSTHHMINAQTIQRMKRGALLINTARGGIVDTEALLAALQSGHLGGAGIDVFEGETLIKEERQLLSNQYNADELRTIIKDLVLLRHENVVVTPHVAFNSVEALERILLTTIQNINAFESGHPINVVT